MRTEFEQNTSPDIAQAAREDYVVLFPLGCVEQHGPHLPLNSDWTMESVTRTAANRAKERHGMKVLVLPLFPYGPAAEHIAFPGTISLSFQTWAAVVTEILANLVRDGFRRIVVVKGCGGHLGIEGPVYQFFAEAKRKAPDLDIRVFGNEATAELGRIARESNIYDPTEYHAGGVETSMVLALTPDLVRLDRLQKTKAQKTSWDSRWWIAEDLTSTGATGDPTRYDVELGKHILDQMAEVLVGFLANAWRRPESA